MVGNRDSETFSVNNIDELHIDNLLFEADNIDDRGNGRYELSGDVRIQDLLRLNGSIILDKDEKYIEGDCSIYIDDIPSFNRVELYDGNFRFGVGGKILDGKGLDKINQMFELGQLPVELENIEFLANGIRLEGILALPEVMGNYEAEIKTIEITKSEGIKLGGKIEIDRIGFSGFKLEDFFIEYNVQEKTFVGEATLVTQPLSIFANAEIIEGKLNSIRVKVSLDKKLPIGATGLAITEGMGAVENIVNPPMRLMLGVTIEPNVPGDFSFIELADLSLAYTFGTKFEGTGSLVIFDQQMANAWLIITDQKASFGGDINLLDILIGYADVAIYKINDSQIELAGNMMATLQLPESSNFPFDLIGSFVDLPYTVASTENHLRNKHIWGNARLTNIFEVSYEMVYENSSIDINWSPNLDLLNQEIFGPDHLKNDRNMNSINRFEGMSLIIDPSDKNAGLRTTGNKIIQRFTLNGADIIVLRLSNETSAPRFELFLPNGEVVTPENITSHSNIEFYKNNEDKKSFFLIKDAFKGEYSVSMESNRYSLDIYGGNYSPSVTIGALHNGGNNLEINWEAYDPDDTARISLYYDTDNFGINGKIITNGIFELDGENSYVWDTEDIPTGDYYIYAQIQDTSNKPVYSYSSGYVGITNENAPESPENLDYQTSGSELKLLWEKTSENVLGYNVYWTSDEELNLNSDSYNVGDTTEFTFSNIIPGKEYRFAVSSVDSDFVESRLSKPVSINFINLSGNNSPVIDKTSLPDIAYANINLNHRIDCYDADGDQIDYTLQVAPEGLSINNSGYLSWNPEITQGGIHPVKLLVQDPGGYSDSALFRIRVLDSLSLKSSIKFNLPLYTEELQEPIITVHDENLNTTAEMEDSSSVKVYSTKDTLGISLIVKETGPNTSIFNTSFFLENDQPLSLPVYDVDTLYAIYEDDNPSQKVTAYALYDNRVSVEELDRKVYKSQLDNNYPNPFNPETNIRFELEERAHVSIEIYNSLGEKVCELIDEEKSRGKHELMWNGKNSAGFRVSSGIYICRFIAKGKKGVKIQSQKMVLLR